MQRPTGPWVTAKRGGDQAAHLKPASAKYVSAAIQGPQYSSRPQDIRIRSSNMLQMSLLGWWMVQTICASE